MDGITASSRRLVRANALAVAVTCACVLAGCVYLAYRPALHTKPLDTDNLVALTIARHASVGHFFTSSFIASLPGYRPLPYLFVKAEYAVLGIGPMHFFLVNLLLVLGAALAMMFLVHALTRNALLAFAVATLFAVDSRWAPALFWVGERQSTMAILFTAVAVGIALHLLPPGTGRTKLAYGALFLVLIVAALSKEYGVAAAVPVALLGLLARPRRIGLVACAAASTALYLILRLGVAGGASVRYCDTMGYLTSDRDVCLGGSVKAGYLTLHGSAVVKQEIWNVFSSFFGSLIPTLFGENGSLSVRSFLTDAPHATTLFLVTVLAFAVIGWVRRPREALPFLGLVAANALLSFLLYRQRNQLVAALGVYASAAVGVYSIGAWWLRDRVGRVLVVACMIGGIGWCVHSIRWHSDSLSAFLGPREAATDSGCHNSTYAPPSDALWRDRRIAIALRRKLDYPNPTCRGYPG